MRTSFHSVHEQKCPVCSKHYQCLDSIRDHLIGLLEVGNCSKIFRNYGCDLCLSLFDSTNALRKHQASCFYSRVTPKLLFRTSSLSILDRLPPSKGGSFRPQVISLSCKMVAGGYDGKLDLCARVCLIDEDENIILHTYVKPLLPVTNYRYERTGIRSSYLKDAMPMRLVQRELQQYLCNGEIMWRVILVGYGLNHDLQCLGLVYPANMIRDTARYPPLLRSCRFPNTLKYLTRTNLGYDIHTGFEDPYEDCVATMRLYKRMCSQVHLVEDYPLASDAHNMNNFAVRRQRELEKMNSHALEISRCNYYCWCLDSRMDS
ncbi:hypothetical protein ACHQM5_024052 [Ranunculus cassubicifolius]